MLTFYADPAFFVLLALIAVPAIVIGALGKSLRVYGMAATAFFLLLLFAGTIEGAAYFIGFVVLSTVLTYTVLRLFDAEHPHAVGIYRAALVLLLVPLATAKISAVFDTNILGFIGISYITFKAIQVLIEIRDGLIKQMSIADYLYFLTFFPVFTSGPIMRSRDFVEQLHDGHSREEYLVLLSEGLMWLLKGVMYALVLAPLAQWLMWFAPEAIPSDWAMVDVLGQLSYAFAYGLFLFFDFAGYTFMAMGVGSAFGIRVPTNFNAPFRSIDIKDFWNRWNMTLSFWLRDFVFMRMTRGLLKHKILPTRLSTATCAFIAEMLLMGAWHGLTADYLLYGLYHGVLLATCEIYQKKSKFYKKHHKKQWYRIISWVITMVAIFFGFAIFSGQVLGLLGF